MKLYELSQAYNDVYDLLTTEEMDEGETRDGIALLEQLETSLHEKLLACARVLKSLEADTDAIKAEEQRLAKRRKAIENNAARLKEYMQSNMESAGLEKASDAVFTVAMQNNPPSVRVLNEKRIPSLYFIPQEPKLDKRSLLNAIKAGEQVDGAELQQTKGVRIR